MIIYLDASALVKRYVVESGSTEVNNWIHKAQVVTTSIISRTEVAAAFQRAARMQIIDTEGCRLALDLFRSEWESFVRLPVNEITVIRADYLTGKHNLRGYDAVHLASALIWQESIGSRVRLITYDDQLRQAGVEEGLLILP
jgi:predicted nucleic acid-binding protein